MTRLCFWVITIIMFVLYFCVVQVIGVFCVHSFSVDIVFYYICILYRYCVVIPTSDLLHLLNRVSYMTLSALMYGILLFRWKTLDLSVEND